VIADLKPYDEYRVSPIAAIGSVPLHWDVVRAKALFREIDERSKTGKEELLSVSHISGVRKRRDHNVTMFLAKSNVGHKVCRTNDLVINTMWAWMGALGVSQHDGLVSPAYGVYRPHGAAQFVPAFLHHVLRTPAYVAEYTIRSTGIHSSRLRMYPEQFLRIPLHLPPIAEQAAIVRFLEWANGRLERAIRAKRKVIALLNEQKQAIIHRAVTRGLVPSAPMKPSGIPWLGDIPHDWTLKRFKFLATINRGQVDPRKPAYRDLPLIAPNHIEKASGRLLGLETASAQGADSGKYLVTQGQIIYSKIRPALRKATIAPIDCLCSADMYPIEPKTPELSVEYFLLLLLSESFTKFAVDASMRVAMPKVNREALADCPLWFPDADQQAKILRLVGLETAPVNHASSRIEREIQLLREYRTRLVADVVTGKLDVREVAVHVPDETLTDAAADDADLGDDAEPSDDEDAVA
jgi:type I restriction enzyme S subunit